MPELPEVQTVVDALIARGLPGRRIREARIFWPRTIAGMPPEAFREQVRGRTVVRIFRRGKYIVFDLDEGLTMLVHLRMTGRFEWLPHRRARGKHEHVVFRIGIADSLRFHDTRKFGRIRLTRQPAAVLGRLGPEPLDRRFTARRFAALLHARKRQLKPLLLDQHVIAGLGNIYVDEALWSAGIHPLRHSHTLTHQDAAKLHRAIRRSLRKGLSNGGTSLGNGQTNFQSPARRSGRNADALNVFRRTGDPCPRCGGGIVRLVVGQRSTHICPDCQR
jgi:formamidopyrimidine-DNA glycosylase